MPPDLTPAEIEILLEGLDYWKTKVAYVKGDTYAEKTAKLVTAEAIEKKLRAAQEGDARA
jgi:hypothetical protein